MERFGLISSFVVKKHQKMTTSVSIVKSRNRRNFKISIAALISIVLLYKWLNDGSVFLLVFASGFAFVALLEFVLFTQTTLELTKNTLKIQRFN